MRFIDAAYASSIQCVHPFPKMIGSLGCLGVTLFFSSTLVSVLALFMSAGLSIHWGRFLAEDYLRWMRSPLLFVLVASLGIAIIPTFPKEALWGLNVGGRFYGLTWSSLLMAAQIGLKALACVGCFYFLLLHTPFSQMVVSLRKARVPESVLALLTLMHRYIFILVDEMGKISMAQRVRLGMKNNATRIRGVGYALGGLFLRTMSRGDAIHNSLQSRSFSGVFFRRRCVDDCFTSNTVTACAMALCFPSLLVFVGLWERCGL